MRAIIVVFSLRPKETKIISKKHTEMSFCVFVFLKKVKQEREIFLGFLLITTTSMESKLAKSYYYFFLVFLRFFKHTRRKHKKKNKLAWILQ